MIVRAGPGGGDRGVRLDQAFDRDRFSEEMEPSKTCRIELDRTERVEAPHVVCDSNCSLACLSEERPVRETGGAGVAYFTADEEPTYYV